ncbi:MAG: Gfo/Idh/MocA family oxidoreductase [Acidimicrobiales bacterium]
MNVPQGSVRPGSVRPGSVRLGFLGAGLIARYHAGSLRAAGCLGSGGSGPAPGGAPAAVLAGVFDPDGERAEQFAHAHGTIVRRSEEEVIEHCDAVYVCTWTAEHRRQVELAAAAGRAVFCEKPLAPTLADARAMAAAVQRAGVVHQVGLVLRSVPGFALLRALLREPAAGRLSTVVFRDDQELPVGGYYGSTWRADRTKAGAGTLLEHSIHDLALLVWLCGPVRTLSAHQDNLHTTASRTRCRCRSASSPAAPGVELHVARRARAGVEPPLRNVRQLGASRPRATPPEAVRWEHRAGEACTRCSALIQQRRRAAEAGRGAAGQRRRRLRRGGGGRRRCLRSGFLGGAAPRWWMRSTARPAPAAPVEVWAD